MTKKQVKRARIKAAEEARRGRLHYRLILHLLTSSHSASLLDKEGDETNREKRDDDPDGHKAISVEDPLEQAAKLLQPFTSQSHQNVPLWITTYDVAIRRSKLLLCCAYAPIHHLYRKVSPSTEGS